ncbi:MerR family transcriptional regulator [Gordoniibacillus kamchatkensis]|uniref:MerR family transcriptional regulator n=1 Tax=Gordoniibacillus kamchatkensis TaxID=1590651 RepID=A0ABR5AAT7_9BACL|nr:MerR family transcriptional regulator [Paenibacillus sp. VKM B-2647]KIL37803.1 MerR family transcriptional regulator [Paenibacillus sp. VKM B-2647]
MYTIGQVAEITGFSPDTLRYYEKLGLVKPPHRSAGGIRTYNDDNVRSLTSLKCLKKTGLSLEEMKEFIQEGQCFANRSTLRDEDEISILNRIKILAEHLNRMEEQRRELDHLINLTQQNLKLHHELLQQRK